MKKFSARMLIAAFLLSVTSPAHAADEDDPDGSGTGNGSKGATVSYSYYLISCGAFIKHRGSGQTTDANNTADTFYVAGWLSAYNRLKFTNAIPEDTTLDDVMLWLEEYCTDKPLSNLEAGMFDLSEEMKQRNSSTTPAETTSRAQPARPAQTHKPAASPAPFHQPVEGLKPLTY